jgi:hypothetical protein
VLTSRMKACVGVGFVVVSGTGFSLSTSVFPLVPLHQCFLFSHSSTTDAILS